MYYTPPMDISCNKIMYLTDHRGDELDESAAITPRVLKCVWFLSKCASISGLYSQLAETRATNLQGDSDFDLFLTWVSSFFHFIQNVEYCS